MSLVALSKMKKKEYQRLGIDEKDIKKFVKIFSKKKSIGDIIGIIVLLVIAAIILFLIFSILNFGFTNFIIVLIILLLAWVLNC